MPRKTSQKKFDITYRRGMVTARGTAAILIQKVAERLGITPEQLLNNALKEHLDRSAAS